MALSPPEKDLLWSSKFQLRVGEMVKNEKERKGKRLKTTPAVGSVPAPGSLPVQGFAPILGSALALDSAPAPE